jgi:Cdc6-like AAA superfamily ATPase
MDLLKGVSFKVEIIAIITSKGFIDKLTHLGSIFHFHEIVFPLYTKDEIRY